MDSSFGVSAYPANAWNKKTIENYFKCFPDECKRTATTLLWGPWGAPVSFAERFIKWSGDRIHTVGIHMSAETARRTGRNGQQIAPYLNVKQYDNALKIKDLDILQSVQDRVIKIIAKISPLCSSTTKIALSVGLEDNLSNEAAKVLINTTRKVLRAHGLSWKVVRNPMTRKTRIGTEWVEGHGRTFHPDTQNIWNFDGVHVGEHDELDDISYWNALKAIKAAKKQYNVVYLWSAVAQGWNGPGQDYAGRTFEITSKEYTGFSSIIREAQK